MNTQVELKLRAVTRALKDLEKASKLGGRVMIRNARRSLWARVRALKDEADAQYMLPVKPKPDMNWARLAKELKVGAFARRIDAKLSPDWYVAPAGKMSPDPVALGRTIDGATGVMVRACAGEGIAPPLLTIDNHGLLFTNHVPDTIGLRKTQFGGFISSLSTWIVYHAGKLNTRRVRFPTGKMVRVLTRAAMTQVNLTSVGILKQEGLIE